MSSSLSNDERAAGFEKRCESTLNEGRHVCLLAKNHDGDCRAMVNAPWPPMAPDQRERKLALIERSLLECRVYHGILADLNWAVAELRSALQREAAWKAAHDRLSCGALPSREE